MKKDYKFRFNNILANQNQKQKPIAHELLMLQNLNCKSQQFQFKQIQSHQNVYSKTVEANSNDSLHKFNEIKFLQTEKSNGKPRITDSKKIRKPYDDNQQQIVADNLYEEDLIRRTSEIINRHILNRYKSFWIIFKAQAERIQQQKCLMVLFTNHCAELIQKNFRRYIQQKYYKKVKSIINRMKELINAAAEGWKVRRVMKTRTILKMVGDIRNKQNQKKFRDMRIMKRQISKQIAKLLKGAKWLEDYKYRIPEKKKNQRIKFQQHKGKNVKLQNNNKKDKNIKYSQQQNRQKTMQATYDQIPIKPAKENPYQKLEEINKIQQNIEMPETKVRKKPITKISNKKQATKDKLQQKQLKIVVTNETIVQKDLKMQQNLIQEKFPQDQKKKYLMKRTKYDPRKAIEEERKRKLQSNKSSEIIKNEQVKSEKRSKSKKTEKQNSLKKDSSTITLKKIGPITKLTLIANGVQKPKVKSNPTPSNLQKHFQISQLETTFNNAYSSKRHQVFSQVEKLNRQYKKMNYPIASIKSHSKIFKAFKLNNYEKLEMLFEKRFREMSRV